MTSIKSRRITAIISLLFMAGVAAFAQSGAYSGYSPYSIFGIGDLEDQGSAYNMTMGGVGIASRNNKYLNMLNPAAVTARDSLAFMADFSLYGENRYFRRNDIKSAGNTFNINDLILTFPIYGPSAMMFGISPYSGTGYGYTYSYDDPSIIGKTGNIICLVFGHFTTTFYGDSIFNLPYNLFYQFVPVLPNPPRSVSFKCSTSVKANSGCFSKIRN
mgnify:CR=1 FL=1